MKALVNFISKNFLLYLLVLFFATKIVTNYAISEYQADMMVKIKQGSPNYTTPEQSAVKGLEIGFYMLNL